MSPRITILLNISIGISRQSGIVKAVSVIPKIFFEIVHGTYLGSIARHTENLSEFSCSLTDAGTVVVVRKQLLNKRNERHGPFKHFRW